MSELEVAENDGSELTERLEELAEKTRVFAGASKSEATKRAYKADFKHFHNWCDEHGFTPLPADPQAVALYFTSLADDGYATATIERRRVAISQAHRLSDLDPPTTDDRVNEVMKGIKRELGTSSSSKAPLTTVEIRRIVRELDRERLIGCRDAALLLIGYAGGLRRSELVGLEMDDIDCREKGIVLRITESKTDQEGEGQIVGIPEGRHDETCPVRALEMWLSAAEIETGPLFRSIRKGGRVSESELSGRAVALVVKRRVEEIGLEPDSYGAHSLRSGFATEAAKGGAGEREIMRQTRHQSRAVVRRYIEEGSALEGNAAEALGL